MSSSEAQISQQLYEAERARLLLEKKIGRMRAEFKQKSAKLESELAEAKVQVEQQAEALAGAREKIDNLEVDSELKDWHLRLKAVDNTRQCQFASQAVPEGNAIKAGQKQPPVTDDRVFRPAPTSNTIFPTHGPKNESVVKHQAALSNPELVQQQQQYADSQPPPPPLQLTRGFGGRPDSPLLHPADQLTRGIGGRPDTRRPPRFAQPTLGVPGRPWDAPNLSSTPQPRKSPAQGKGVTSIGASAGLQVLKSPFSTTPPVSREGLTQPSPSLKPAPTLFEPKESRTMAQVAASSWAQEYDSAEEYFLDAPPDPALLRKRKSEEISGTSPATNDTPASDATPASEPLPPSGTIHKDQKASRERDVKHRKIC